MIHSSTLGFSPRPPVSVYGTGRCILNANEVFLGSSFNRYLRPRRFAVLSCTWQPRRICLPGPICFPLQRRLPSLRGLLSTPSPHALYSKYWNINQLAIDYAFRLRLRSRLTLLRLSLRQETLVFRCAGFSPALSLLMPTFAFPVAPAKLTLHLRSDWNALLPLYNCL